VINTCTVTASADADSRKSIRRAALAGVDKVVVTGCWVTMHPEEARTLIGDNTIVQNREKDNLVELVVENSDLSFDLEPLQREIIPGKRSRTRAFIKAQDGCDNRCTFCITTIARGSAQSKKIDDLIFEINSLTSESINESRTPVREIVLTGVHLGAWGKDLISPLTLKDLISAILNNTTVPRIRLSSLEPWDLDDDFFNLWVNPRMCRHLHLPLQSGCAATLRRMARKTSLKSYRELIQKARTAIPGVAITTDIITGFPGETEREFAESIEFVRKMHFAGGHVFTYSERSGTAAAKMPNPIEVPIRKNRNSEMRAVLKESQKDYQNRFSGSFLDVLWESSEQVGEGEWLLSGLTDNYLRIFSKSEQNLWNQISRVQVMGVSDAGIKGVLCK
jgi:threonylcarbamoyladenosine tRNA methylthiotransferase MtaB